MKYYINPKLKSTIASPGSADLKINGYVEVTEDEYVAQGGVPRVDSESTTYKVVISDSTEEEDEEEVEETDPVEVNDLVDDLFSNLAQSEVESAPVIKLDESVMALEEEAASNSFESIKELRAHAEKDREATVTKGKAHGVYTYDKTADKWNKTGEI